MARDSNGRMICYDNTENLGFIMHLKLLITQSTAYYALNVCIWVKIMNFTGISFLSTILCFNSCCFFSLNLNVARLLLLLLVKDYSAAYVSHKASNNHTAQNIACSIHLEVLKLNSNSNNVQTISVVTHLLSPRHLSIKLDKFNTKNHFKYLSKTTNQLRILHSIPH